MLDQSHIASPVTRWIDRDFRRLDDEVVVEEPLEIRINGEPLTVTMRTPGEDVALSIGFLLTEGLIRRIEDVWDVKRCGHPRHPDSLNVVDVVVNPDVFAADNGKDDKSPRLLSGRQRYASSSCGVCGRASIELIRTIASPIRSVPKLDARTILSLPDSLRSAQGVFQRTGGLHAAGLFTNTGTLLCVAEDVGRHNAVDKVAGMALMSVQEPPELGDCVLAVSGRAGFEIVQKALVARIPAVCSVSAPSSLAVELAAESGMILAGFVRPGGFNVYAGAEFVVQ